jgi:hypothetical protein
MPLSCGWNDMNAAFMSYEESAGPGSRRHGSAQGALRHHWHRRPTTTPAHDQNKLSDSALEQHKCGIHPVKSDLGSDGRRLRARAAGRDSGQSARQRIDRGRILAGAAYPGVALPLLVDPVLVDPVLVDPASAVPLPTAPVFVDPAFVVAPGVVAGGVVSVGPVLGATEEGGLDVGEAGVEELLPGVGDDGVTLGLAAPDGLAGGDEHGVSVALTDVSPFALPLAFAEAAELAVLVAAEVAVAVAVVLAVPVGVPVTVPPSPGLLLVLPLGGLLTEFSGDGLGAADFAGAVLAEADGELVAHPVASVAPWPADVPP